MKRTAVSLLVWCAISGWAAAGHARKARPAPPPPPAAEPAPAPAEEKAAPAAAEKAETPAAADEKEAAVNEALEPDEAKPGKVEEGEGQGKPVKLSTASWQDIVVVPRKPFLKGGRLELAPFTGISINDNLIRHYAFGADINYFLSDVLWIGVQGEYFVKSFSERDELIGLQYNRIPTLNRYLYGAALNFGYVPVYGKFALFNKWIIPWEIYASAGAGWTRSQVIPRNPGDLGWNNDLLTATGALGSRFFLFDWLTVNLAVRDYLIPDKFEPTNRMSTESIAVLKARADTKFVNNVMVYAGVGMYLPAKFQYKSPR
ncbi:MAG TPA: outer membrane beta-barrel domain-containing protein [Polyangia bacterium]|jgi:outer membrane beta-barrel protein|nr:outer membrane beta-barrel domain-containing protein [Polyangia bacterium]